MPGEKVVPVKCDIFTSTSPFFDKEFYRSLALAPGVCKHVGLPRNDELFMGENELEGMYPNFKKKIIWMPTFRKTATYTNGIDTELGVPCLQRAQLEELNSMLHNLNYLLILKLHPWSADKLAGLDFSNIVNIRDADLPENLSLYKLLGQTDALITDYSSVYIDYMLLDRPICFAYDDLDEYRKTRGFAFEPIEDYMPGEVVTNYDELIDWLKKFAMQDNYAQKRNELKKMFFVHPDGNSAKRTLQELLDL